MRILHGAYHEKPSVFPMVQSCPRLANIWQYSGSKTSFLWFDRAKSLRQWWMPFDTAPHVTCVLFWEKIIRPQFPTLFVSVQVWVLVLFVIWIEYTRVGGLFLLATDVWFFSRRSKYFFCAKFPLLRSTQSKHAFAWWPFWEQIYRPISRNISICIKQRWSLLTRFGLKSSV